MRGLYCAFISYTIMDIIISLDNALSLGMNPLRMFLISVCTTLAIYFGIERLIEHPEEEEYGKEKQ